jgi:hypothetical protein
MAAYIDSHRKSRELVATVGDALQNANALVYYGRRSGVERGRLFWTERDRKRMPSWLRALKLATPTQSDVEITKLLQDRPGLWVVVRGIIASSKLNPFYEWAARCGRRQTFRGVDVLHLVPCSR